MTADLVKGKSFRGALRYNLEKVETKGAKVLDTNFSSIAERDIMKEIFLVRMQRPALSKYFYHTSINFPPDENLSDQKITAIAKEFLFRKWFQPTSIYTFSASRCRASARSSVGKPDWVRWKYSIR
jgi:hypothetical protein